MQYNCKAFLLQISYSGRDIIFSKILANLSIWIKLSSFDD